MFRITLGSYDHQHLRDNRLTGFSDLQKLPQEVKGPEPVLLILNLQFFCCNNHGSWCYSMLSGISISKFPQTSAFGIFETSNVSKTPYGIWSWVTFSNPSFLARYRNINYLKIADKVVSAEWSSKQLCDSSLPQKHWETSRNDQNRFCQNSRNQSKVHSNQANAEFGKRQRENGRKALWHFSLCQTPPRPCGGISLEAVGPRAANRSSVPEAEEQNTLANYCLWLL